MPERMQVEVPYLPGRDFVQLKTLDRNLKAPRECSKWRIHETSKTSRERLHWTHDDTPHPSGPCMLPSAEGELGGCSGDWEGTALSSPVLEHEFQVEGGRHDSWSRDVTSAGCWFIWYVQYQLATCYAASFQGDITTISSTVSGGFFTECIHELVLESQLPNKTGSLIFSWVVVNKKLSILWGIWLSKTDQ